MLQVVEFNVTINLFFNKKITNHCARNNSNFKGKMERENKSK
jgi:hypothetical protein